MAHLEFGELQRQVGAWSRRNFGDQPAYRALLGAVEEIGELAHAHLKGEQGIRGTVAFHEAEGMDAVGDTIIFLADYCERRGWDLGAIVAQTWNEVKQRAWQASPQDGTATPTKGETP